MAYLTLKNINKIYPNGYHAVHNFNLDIEKGEFIVFVGPSGCGKSTTLRMIAGLEDISNGDFLINGNRANEWGPRQREVAMVFQSYALYPQMTVFDNIAFGLTLQGVDEDVIEEKVNHTAAILGLTDYLDRLPRALSGGQRQRVAIGRALIRKVGVFLMDEPLSNRPRPHQKGRRLFDGRAALQPGREAACHDAFRDRADPQIHRSHDHLCHA